MKTYVVSVKKSTREVSGRWLKLQEGTEEGDRVQGIVQVTFDQNVGQHSQHTVPHIPKQSIQSGRIQRALRQHIYKYLML